MNERLGHEEARLKQIVAAIQVKEQEIGNLRNEGVTTQGRIEILKELIAEEQKGSSE